MGEGAINDLAFSPCGKYLAVASQDGCLRVLHYERMELVGLCTSYFGGLLCACWSPDGQLVVCGGEDDLVTVWSFPQRRVVARGRGHRSWVTVVAFDPFTSVFSKQGAAGCSAADPAATAALNSNASSTEGNCYRRFDVSRTEYGRCIANRTANGELTSNSTRTI